MPSHLIWLDADHPFPDPQLAWPEGSEAPGLLAAGADLSPERLVEAYQQGIFPWYSAGQPILWWSPNPRMVLQTAHFRLHRSLRKVLAKFLRTPGCTLHFNRDFDRVIQYCAQTPRSGQAGTWILPEMVLAYRQLHRLGIAHSVETWIDGELVGGLYGVRLGKMFFGESMFSHQTDASKLALCALVAHARLWDIPWIDCQQQTRHLASLGAAPVERAGFTQHLQKTIIEPLDQGYQPPDWAYDSRAWATLGLGAA